MLIILHSFFGHPYSMLAWLFYSKPFKHLTRIRFAHQTIFLAFMPRMFLFGQHSKPLSPHFIMAEKVNANKNTSNDQSHLDHPQYGNSSCTSYFATHPPLSFVGCVGSKGQIQIGLPSLPVLGFIVESHTLHLGAPPFFFFIVSAVLLAAIIPSRPVVIKSPP